MEKRVEPCRELLEGNLDLLALNRMMCFVFVVVDHCLYLLSSFY